MNYSASFVLPMLNIPYVYKFLVNTYCGDINFTEGELGEYFFVHLNKKIDIIHNQLVCSYEEDNSFVYVFKVTEEQRSTILNKFMNGEYSKIDRDYVKNSFQPSETSTNYLVLTKSDKLRTYWENRIGLSLPKDAEVWSKPNLEQEVFVPLDHLESRTN